MAFRFSFPYDGRAHREEELTAARLAAQHQTGMRQPIRPLDGAATPVEKLEGSAEPASPTPSPQSGRRNVVFADPVAFRYGR